MVEPPGPARGSRSTATSITDIRIAFRSWSVCVRAACGNHSERKVEQAHRIREAGAGTGGREPDHHRASGVFSVPAIRTCWCRPSRNIVSTLDACRRLVAADVGSIPDPSEYVAKLKKRNHFLRSVLEQKKVFVVGDENELRRLGKERLARNPPEQPLIQNTRTTRIGLSSSE